MKNRHAHQQWVDRTLLASMPTTFLTFMFCALRIRAALCTKKKCQNFPCSGHLQTVTMLALE